LNCCICHPVQITYCSICSNSLFSKMIFFRFQAQSLFKQAAVRLSFLPCNVSHSKLSFSRQFILPSSVRSESFLIHFFISLLYKSPCFLSINSSVLILFLIGKVITEILAQHAHLDIARNFCLLLYSSWPTLL